MSPRSREKKSIVVKFEQRAAQDTSVRKRTSSDVCHASRGQQLDYVITHAPFISRTDKRAAAGGEFARGARARAVDRSSFVRSTAASRTGYGISSTQLTREQPALSLRGQCHVENQFALLRFIARVRCAI